jgi:hypothetical protein
MKVLFAISTVLSFFTILGADANGLSSRTLTLVADEGTKVQIVYRPESSVSGSNGGVYSVYIERIVVEPSPQSLAQSVTLQFDANRQWLQNGGSPVVFSTDFPCQEGVCTKSFEYPYPTFVTGSNTIQNGPQTYPWFAKISVGQKTLVDPIAPGELRETFQLMFSRF